MTFYTVLKYGDVSNCGFRYLGKFSRIANKLTYTFRCGPVPYAPNGRWHRKSRNVLKYKHFLIMSEKDIHPLSYDNESLGEVSFGKIKFKKCYRDIDWKDYDPKCGNYRTHMSWKKTKKKKQWM